MYKSRKLALSLVLTFSLALSFLSTNILALSTPAINDCQFKFSHLVTVDDADTLIFTYLGENYDTIQLELISKDTSEVEFILLSAGNTSAEFDNVVVGKEYSYSITIGEDYSHSGSLTMTEYGVDYTDDTPSLTAAGQTFQAKNGTTNIGSSTTSLFKAIENARSSGISEASVVMNSSTTVFKMTTSTTYYKYQFDQYYGSTTSLSEAKSWIIGYNYSHIIDGNGYPTYDYLQDVNGGLTGTSTNALIERNSGAYYFNFAKQSTTYKKLSVEVDLSSMTAKKANTGAYDNNGYIFVGAKQSRTFEVGLIFPTKSGATIYPYYMKGDGVIYSQTNTPIAVGTTDSSGEMSFSDKIRITIAVGNGTQICKVENLTTGVVWEETVSNSNVSSTASTQFFYAASLVHDDPANALHDLRCGGYMKNIKFSSPLVYTAASATSGTSALPTTTVSELAFLYNTDCGSYSRSGSGTTAVETISIYYDSIRT